MQSQVLAQHPELDFPVTVIESAYPSLVKQTTTYTIAVYAADEEALRTRLTEENPEKTVTDADYGAALQALLRYSKSPAAKDTALKRLGTATLVLNGDGSLLSYEDDLKDPASP